MRVFLLFLPAVLMAQGAAPQSTPPKAAAPKAATPGAPKTSPAKAAPKGTASGAPMTEEEKVVYAFGVQLYKQLQAYDLSPAEIELVKRGISDAAANKTSGLDFTVLGQKM